MKFIVMKSVPDSEEQHHEKRFRTYLNYLMSIEEFLEPAVADPEKLAKVIIGNKSFQAITGGKLSDIDKLGRLLRNAWFTEIQISLSGKNPDYIPFSIHWTPVQVYYSVYLALRGFLLASGQDVHGDHQASLKAFSNGVATRPDLYPFPWKLLCDGDVKEPNYVNLPKGRTVQPLSSLQTGGKELFLDSYSMFLRTTRERSLERVCDQWKNANKKKRIPAIEREKLVNNQAPTSLLHCLYRLRIRSNYVDADSFMFPPSVGGEAVRFYTGLRTICWSTLLMLEILTARYIGKKTFSSFVDEFVGLTEHGEELVGRRWAAVRNLW